MNGERRYLVRQPIRHYVDLAHFPTEFLNLRERRVAAMISQI